MTTKHKACSPMALAIAVAGINMASSSLANVDDSDIRLNQIGYLPKAQKIASVIRNGDTGPVVWELQDDTGQPVMVGGELVGGTVPESEINQDLLSEDYIAKIDFSAVQTPGEYQLSVQGEGVSVSFEIQESLYSSLINDALYYFTFHRQFMPINDTWGLRNIHDTWTNVPCLNDWCGGETFNLAGTGPNGQGGAWSDAGDYGLYPVNHAISAWTLLNAYELLGDAYLGDGTLPVLEDNNGIADVVDEVEFGSRYLEAMLPLNNSLHASHKVHVTEWQNFFATPDIEDGNNVQRHLREGSTASSYAIARTNAQLVRNLYQQADNTSDTALAQSLRDRADHLWVIAEDAYNRGKNLEIKRWNYSGAEIIPDQERRHIGGGAYEDSIVDDDAFAAATEMYLTAKALNIPNNYDSDMNYSGDIRLLNWQNVEMSAYMSLIANGDTSTLVSAAEAEIIAQADNYLATIASNGYPHTIPKAQDFFWGSNGTIANNALVLGYAYRLTDNVDYLKAMHRIMDYFLGNNPNKLSYITGYGEFAEEDLHDRVAFNVWQNSNYTTAFPDGWIAGGPNSGSWDANGNNTGPCEDGDLGITGQGNPATPTNVPPAKRYAPYGEGHHAWCSKENTINWNAPVVWLAAFLETHRDALNCDGGCGGPEALDGEINLAVTNTLNLAILNGNPEGASFILANDDNGRANLNGTLVTYTPEAGFAGTTSFTYKMIVDGEESDTATITVTQPTSSASCQMEVTLDPHQYGNQWQARLAIENLTESDLTDWEVILTFDHDGNAATDDEIKLGTEWGPGSYNANVAELTGSDTTTAYRITSNANWNANIAAGSTYVVELVGEAGPRAVDLNWQPNPNPISVSERLPEISGSTCGSTGNLQPLVIYTPEDGATVTQEQWFHVSWFNGTIDPETGDSKQVFIRISQNDELILLIDPWAGQGSWTGADIHASNLPAGPVELQLVTDPDLPTEERSEPITLNVEEVVQPVYWQSGSCFHTEVAYQGMFLWVGRLNITNTTDSMATASNFRMALTFPSDETEYYGERQLSPTGGGGDGINIEKISDREFIVTLNAGESIAPGQTKTYTLGGQGSDHNPSASCMTIN